MFMAKKKALSVEVAYGDCGFLEATFWLLPLDYCCSHPPGNVVWSVVLPQIPITQRE